MLGKRRQVDFPPPPTRTRNTTKMVKQEDRPATIMNEGGGIKNISVLLVALLALSSISAAADSVVGEVRPFYSRKIVW